jgi:fructose-1-phosphate kinase PfkB-like protein
MKHHAILDTTNEVLRLGCAENPYLINPNTEEVHALTGVPVDGTTEIAAAAAKLRKMSA